MMCVVVFLFPCLHLAQKILLQGLTVVLAIALTSTYTNMHVREDTDNLLAYARRILL